IAFAERNRPGPGKYDVIGIGLVKDMVISAFLSVAHSAPGSRRRSGLREDLEALHQELTYQRRVPGRPRKRRLMELAGVIGVEPGVHQDQCRQPIEPLQRGPNALRAAPVLPDDDETAQLELVDQRNQIGDVMRERKRCVDARMVGIAGAYPVGNHDPIAGAGERADEIAIEESPSRVSVQEQYWTRVASALVDIGHVAAVDTNRPLLP